MLKMSGTQPRVLDNLTMSEEVQMLKELLNKSNK